MNYLSKVSLFFFYLIFLGTGCVADLPVQKEIQNQPSYNQPKDYPVIASESERPVLRVEKKNVETIKAEKPAVKEKAAAPNGYYKNVDGNSVARPYAAPTRPAGASAQCRDGTYSFSQNRRGTCSGHSGVAEWF